MLAILIARAKEVDQIGGLLSHLVNGGISIQQYVDDTILCMEHDIAKALNMKLILCIFEQLSGLKINFNMSEIFCLVEQRILNNNICKFLDVRQELYHLNILEFSSITES
jgi:hypothetical protein